MSASKQPEQASQASASPESVRSVFDDGVEQTKAALRHWHRDKFKELLPWGLYALLIACGMILGVWTLSALGTPQRPYAGLSGTYPPVPSVGHVLLSNGVVLALHAFICMAGFLAMFAVPAVGVKQGRLSRILHMQVSKGATWFIVGATLFSLGSQIWHLSRIAIDVSSTYSLTPTEIIISILPHALIELTAVFLPLSAFIILSRQDKPKELLAATIVTVVLALPMLVFAAALEHFTWPLLFRSFS